ncbi:MAG: tripartite tricarboxylate transporter substrate binding protein [Paracoccus sp. (in: a-proteobacteria)]|uniref:Bug family tripartite tricarboxylate transporter substrate binding protein n=1 Tax=Paracoccus sp. TaxID=267 RepID=UPI0026DF3E04|nr:tripartite tricarboxylate transporter substrate binding protein [Paracoccus sp. (in: a-proteobacteria)]MDO5613880.1 tripartite tricarboxylate transporter substrate binding protein [Paracoccus sp. (in: a-proteobacteria)]
MKATKKAAPAIRRLIALFRTTFAALALSALPIAQPQSAAADDFPQKTVTLVVWSGAGGALDTYGRKLAELLEKEAGWTVKVDNRSGGSGAVGLSQIMTQPADGHSILVLTGTLTFGIAQGLIPFQLEDLRLLRAMQSEPSSLAVLKDSPFQNVQQLVDHMKANPNGLKIGGHSSGGFHQYMLYQLMKQTGFESGWIPHDASGKVTLALLGHHIDAAMMTPSTGLSQVKNGDIRLLGITTAERSPFLPEAPTFDEQGLTLEGAIWRGVAVKAGTPDDVVATIQTAIDKVTASDDWKAFQQEQFQDSPDWNEAEFTERTRKDLEEQREFLEATGFIK